MNEVSEREEYDSFVIPPTLDAPDGDTTEDDGSPVSIVETDGKRQLVGYAIVWGAVSTIRRMGKQHRFARGSIIWRTPTAALWHHDYATPLGSTFNNTLSVVEDDHGAKVVMDLDDTTDGQNAFSRVKSKLVWGMSFGGVPLGFKPTTDPGVMDVTSFLADEVSLTMRPSMTETHVVTADKSDDLQKKVPAQKDSTMRLQKSNLDKIRLALLKP